MHTVTWTISVNEGTSKQDIVRGLEASVAEYRTISGLRKAYFGLTANGKSVIETTHWQTKSDADRFFSSEGETNLFRRWQSAPMKRLDSETLYVAEGG